MSGGSKKTTTEQTQTNTNTLDPEFKALVMGNYDTAKANAAGLATPFTGQLTAGFNPTQLQAQGILSGIGTNPLYANNANQATDAAKGILGVNPGTIAGADLSQYMNPYTKNVIDSTIADQERARQIAQVADAQKATAAGAFGGSRSGVMAAETNGAYDRNTGSLIAGLNQDAFNNAQTAAQSDINNRINGANLKLNAAGDVANLNNNALGVAGTQAGILGGVGDIQQQQQQQGLDRIYQNWLTGKQLTLQEQNLLNSALGLVPVQQTVTGNTSGTSTEKTSGGFGSMLGGFGSLLGGIGALGGDGGIMALSDERTKADIKTIGHDASGRRWVSFRYKWEPEGTVNKGVIAQEILRSDPSAVHLGSDGLYRVDYSKLGGV